MESSDHIQQRAAIQHCSAPHVCFHCITGSVAQAKVTVDLQKHREAQAQPILLLGQWL